MTVSVIDVDRVDEIWPLIEPGVARAAASGYGEADTDDILKGIKSGLSLLVMIQSDRGVCGMVVSIHDYPKYKVCKIHAAFGRNLHTGDDEDAFDNWMRSVGCRYIEAQCSTDSRLKVFAKHGYKPAYTIIRKPL